MSATTSHPPAATTPIYDGYATIRSRGLCRSGSIRAAELEAAAAGKDVDTPIARSQVVRSQIERRRTFSLKSNLDRASHCGAVEDHTRRLFAKPVQAPRIGGSSEPLYASVNGACSTFRPVSDGSSSSGADSMSGCRDSFVESTGSGSVTSEYKHIKKMLHFSLDSLQSSITSKTPDYTTAEEENIFLYTAPASPKQLPEEEMRNSHASSEQGYNSSIRNSFKMQELPRPAGHFSSEPSQVKHRRSIPARIRTNTNIQYNRAQSLGEGHNVMATTSSYDERRRRNNSDGFIATSQPTMSPTGPPTPIRRESLYAKPKIYVSPTYQLSSSPISDIHEEPRVKSIRSRLSTSVSPQRSSSVEVLERSFTSQSLATVDQDELAMPIAMPVLPNPVDRRYHTLGHMRVRSLGAHLHRTYDSPMNSMFNMMSGTFYSPRGCSVHNYGNLHPNKSAGNICESLETTIADLNRLAPEYVDPLDIKIGCQTTLRSKPVIPWYELAIKHDIKRQSCPPINGVEDVIHNRSATLGRGQGNQAHVVAAFEQSLSNMTSRLQQLTATSERKDGELTDMRQTIELLRKQSVQAGLTTAHMQSMGVQTQSQSQNNLLGSKPPPIPAPLMLGHQNRMEAAQQQQKLAPHNQAAPSGTVGVNASGTIERHHSSDSMCSLNSVSSGCSTQDKKKKKGWLRSSFTKAFSRNAKISKTNRHIIQQGGDTANNGAPRDYMGAAGNVATSSPFKPNQRRNEPAGLAALATQSPPLPVTPTKNSSTKTVTVIENAKPIDAIDHDEKQVVEDLKKQLREKDLVLTDIRLEALSSASQLESLKETVNKMRAEMLSLKQNNERLQKLVTTRSLTGSEVSLGNAISPSGSTGESRRYSLADNNGRPPMELPKRLEEDVEEENIPPAPAPEPSPTPKHIDLTPPPPPLESVPSPAHIPAAIEENPDVTDGKKIAIACYLGQPESFVKYCEEILEVDEYYANTSADKDIQDCLHFPTASLNEFIIAYTYISGKTTWQNLDYIVRKTFKDYVSRIDPGTNLGLNTDSITSYHLGEAKRGPEMGFPELLPCGYIVGNVRTLYICLQGVGSMAFDSLIPRSIVHRYISLLTEHRRLILCGPSGTGKSYLARRLAEFLVARSGRGNPSEAIATFNVDHKSSKELRQYLSHIAEQAAIANGAFELPSVIILDNLHHASALGDVFSCLLSAAPAAKLPCIIGTMSQATCNTTNLQLHHNFRWVLTANHMEPVKGFLGRFLRRRLFQLELQTQQPQSELAAVLAWLPTVWQHINRFLEIHSSSDVTIGPRLFLACPLDLKDSQVWFTDIWNYHLSPYLVEAVREGVQLYGRRGGAWNDPSAFIRNSYPWTYGPDSVPPLRQINAEDVGLEGVVASNGENQDPLLNMLMRLQEAANYSENHEQESDCASLDSNLTPDSSAGAE